MPSTELIAVQQASPMTIHIALPTTAASAVAVIVAHELFGVSPDIRAILDDLAAAGHLAVAPEFYHRQAAPGRWFARDDDGRRESFALLHQLDREDAVADVSAAIAWLRTHPRIEKIAMIGFSAGGHLAYLAACRLPLDCTVVLYGGWLPTTDIPLSRPNPTLELTPGIRGKVLYLVGDADDVLGTGQREAVRHALQDANIDHEYVSYPGVEHAFFWPDTPAYNEAARRDAWQRTLAMLSTA